MDNLETQVDQNNATIGNLTSDVESQGQELNTVVEELELVRTAMLK